MFLKVLLLVLPLTVIGIGQRNESINLRDPNLLDDILWLFLSKHIPGTLRGIDGDWNKDFMQLASKYGYRGEAREVTTEDNYILTMHRLRNRRINSNGRVIFLMHGIQDSSDSWMIQGPGRALAYILADKGYDVWMGNARGNRYSHRHQYLSTDRKEFWGFTIEQIALFDLPMMIEYILATTNCTSLYYVGFSQGATIYYIMNSELDTYNNKIARIFSLAPVAWLRQVKSPMLVLFPPVYKELESVMGDLNTLMPNTSFFKTILIILCAISKTSCENIIFIFNGDEHLFDTSLYQAILSRIPSGTSIKQFLYYGQLMESGRFCRYDYGFDVNLLLYNSSTPPDINLTKMTVPETVYYSDKDWIASSADVTTLLDNLGNLTSKIFVPGFSHLDFLYASEAKDTIYLDIMKIIDEDYKSDSNKTLSDPSKSTNASI